MLGWEGAEGCQLYFCVGFLPKENQPVSSSVAQPIRNWAEARIWMWDIQIYGFISAYFLLSTELHFALCRAHRRDPQPYNQLSTSGYFLCKTLQNTEECGGCCWHEGEKIWAQLTTEGEPLQWTGYTHKQKMGTKHWKEKNACQRTVGVGKDLASSQVTQKLCIQTSIFSLS